MGCDGLKERECVWGQEGREEVLAVRKEEVFCRAL